jgi:beta-glucuronidase
MLRPQRNRFRDHVELSGLWRFALDADDRGEALGWQHGIPAGIEIAVPGSFNEQLEARGLRDYVGAFWLETTAFVPTGFSARALSLYVGSADFSATAWIDGECIGTHDLPFLPFEFELPAAVKAGTSIRIVLRLDTRLGSDDPLPGIVREDYVREGRPRDEIYPAVRFDFFPFGGVHRPPYLCARPKQRIESVAVRGDRLDARHGRVSVTAQCRVATGTLRLRLIDVGGVGVAQAAVELHGGHVEASLELTPCRFWSPTDPHLYRLELELGCGGEAVDVLVLPVGVRRIEVVGRQLLLNGEAIQLRGFGMHEDFAALGKGQALAVTVRDLELLRWTGANCFRTSHYAYAEETLDLADRQGLLVISELACVNLDFRRTSNTSLTRHRRTLQAQIARDRNHAAVVMWSIANEPGYLGESEYRERSGEYWRELVAVARAADSSRPLMVANVEHAGREDPAFDHCDVVALNRYYGWYTMPGQIDRACERLAQELAFLAQRYAKPILVTEFGADAVAGMHALADQLFSEEYQAELLRRSLATIAAEPAAAGALVWNFADFRTAQHHRRVILNHKGVFTRSRDPKRAAFVLRELWRRS